MACTAQEESGKYVEEESRLKQILRIVENVAGDLDLNTTWGELRQLLERQLELEVVAEHKNAILEKFFDMKKPVTENDDSSSDAVGDGESEYEEDEREIEHFEKKDDERYRAASQDVKHLFGQVVWTKCNKKFPWWPSYIYDATRLKLELTIKAINNLPKKVIVFNYGSRDYGFAPLDMIRDFNEHLDEFSKQKMSKRDEKSFKVAVEMAKEEIALPVEERVKFLHPKIPPKNTRPKKTAPSTKTVSRKRKATTLERGRKKRLDVDEGHDSSDASVVPDDIPKDATGKTSREESVDYNDDEKEEEDDEEEEDEEEEEDYEDDDDDDYVEEESKKKKVRTSRPAKKMRKLESASAFKSKEEKIRKEGKSTIGSSDYNRESKEQKLKNETRGERATRLTKYLELQTEEDKILKTIMKLDNMNMTLQEMSASRAGKVVSGLRKHHLPTVSRLAKEIRERWINSTKSCVSSSATSSSSSLSTTTMTTLPTSDSKLEERTEKIETLSEKGLNLKEGTKLLEQQREERQKVGASKTTAVESNIESPAARVVESGEKEALIERKAQDVTEKRNAGLGAAYLQSDLGDALKKNRKDESSEEGKSELDDAMEKEVFSPDKLDAKVQADPVRLNAVMMLFETMGKIAPCAYIENAFYEYFQDKGEDGINNFIDRICRLSFALKKPDASDYLKKLCEEYETMDLTSDTGLVNMCDSRYNLSLLFVN